MSSLSVNSVSSSNIYVSTSIAQQKVATDREDVLETETQLAEENAQLDKDLTYLGTLQHKTQDVQKLENSQAQTNALDHISKSVQAAKLATQQALSSLVASTSGASTVGTNVNVYA
jgi:hypothetical protein